MQQYIQLVPPWPSSLSFQEVEFMKLYTVTTIHNLNSQWACSLTWKCNKSLHGSSMSMDGNPHALYVDSLIGPVLSDLSQHAHHIFPTAHSCRSSVTGTWSSPVCLPVKLSHGCGSVKYCCSFLCPRLGVSRACAPPAINPQTLFLPFFLHVFFQNFKH